MYKIKETNIIFALDKYHFYYQRLFFLVAIRLQLDRAKSSFSHVYLYYIKESVFDGMYFASSYEETTFLRYGVIITLLTDEYIRLYFRS